ncbi:recombinase RecT [Cereibacter sphaeroides f. sp. denitrificans]|nr:hypothetical protein DWF04_06265 [Cereibacter sphaeroides f. sp. denitrificans]
MTTENRLPATKLPLRQVPNVRTLLVNDNARDQLKTVAAKHMNPERMMRVVANAIRTTPKLQECEPMSFLGALMHCASMGLEPNTPLGHAYLIPFENKRKGVTEVQVVIGYKGFIDLARRSGQLASIHGDVVYDDDELWSHEYGSNMHLRHRPGPRKGKRLGAYCHVKLNLGDGITAEGHRFMTMEEIIAHRNQYSQGWKTAMRFNKTAESPWNEANPAFEAMAIKTVVRALANRGELPMSIEFMEAMNTDEQQADYRAFAMDPTAGVTIEGEAEEGHDPETGEVRDGQPKQVENMRTLDDAPKQRDPAPAARQRRQEKPREDATPYAQNPAAEDLLQREAARVAEQRAKAAQQHDPRADDVGIESIHHGLKDRICNDLTDATTPEMVEQVLDLWADQIAAMEREAPRVFAQLHEEIEAARSRD